MSIESPKATVLISTYNRPDYLREAIASVVAQRMTDWELIVMNDGGVDVGHIIDEFNDPRIRYFPDDVNKGAAYRFNRGLENAQGDYITYLGDDDLFYPNHLEVLCRALDENPDIGLAYSDLYAVSCVKDEETGKRYVMDKRLIVSRDFNRQFMFHYNHVLHVSLMHRKEAAFRVGCFDESVKVLIEWSLNRRLAFIYDFLRVPVATGEYYMPVFKSDRISVIQRKDKEGYRHNLRKIRSNLPEEPWSRVDKVSVIYNVREWNEKVNEKIGDVIDGIDHPFRFILVNNGTGKTEAECRNALGKLTELKNIHIRTARGKLPELDAYRFGAQRTDADYLLLITDNFQAKKMPKRLFGGLEFLKNNPKTEAVKWDIEEERRTVFDILLKKSVFLKRSNLKKGQNSIDIQYISQLVPAGFKFDTLFAEYRRSFGKGDYHTARTMVEASLMIEKGVPKIEFLIDPLFKVCMAQRDYGTIEPKLIDLIERGYEPDNLIRLGVLYQETDRFKEAIDAYYKGLNSFGLKEKHLESPVFPFNFPKELSAFTALIGLGECYLALGVQKEAARFLHHAAKLRANSYKPFLGFAKLFLDAGQLERVDYALRQAGERDARKDPETHRLLGKLCERKDRLDLAFECYIKAFEADKTDEKNIDPLYYAGAGLGRWYDMVEPLDNFLKGQPGHVKAITRLASIYLQIGDYYKAQELTGRGLVIEPGNSILASIDQRSRNELIRMPDPFKPNLNDDPFGFQGLGMNNLGLGNFWETTNK